MNFSKLRVLQMAKLKYTNLSEEQCKQKLSSIRLYHAFQFGGLLDVLESLAQSGDCRNSVIIIDSISTILLVGKRIGKITDPKELHRRRLANVAQFSAAIKSVSHQTDSIAVFTRLATSELRFNWDARLAPDLSVTLEKDETSRITKVNATNRTCDIIGPIGDITFQIDDSGVV